MKILSYALPFFAICSACHFDSTIKPPAKDKLVTQFVDSVLVPGSVKYQFAELVSVYYYPNRKVWLVSVFGDYYNPDPETFNTYDLEYVYDDHDNIVKSYVYQDTVKALNGIYAYDSQNRVTSATIYQFNSSAVVYKDTWSYSDNRITLLRTDYRNLQTRYEFQYDGGNCIEEHISSPYSDAAYFFSYDNKPSPGKGVFYDFLNNFGGQSWATPNRNNIIKESTFDVEPKIKYDADGYPVEETHAYVGRKRCYFYTAF